MENRFSTKLKQIDSILFGYLMASARELYILSLSVEDFGCKKMHESFSDMVYVLDKIRLIDKNK